MSDNTTATSLHFDDLEPRVIPVTIKGKKYYLREASEGVASAYRNSTLRNIRMDDGKIVGMGNIADAQAVLVAGCLFEVVAQGDAATGGSSVSLQFVKDLPARVVKQLFEQAKKISDLNETKDEGEAPKELPTATTPSSS